MEVVNYVRNGRRFGDRKMLTGAKIPKMSLQAYSNTIAAQPNNPPPPVNQPPSVESDSSYRTPGLVNFAYREHNLQLVQEQVVSRK